MYCQFKFFQFHERNEEITLKWLLLCTENTTHNRYIYILIQITSCKETIVF